LKLFVDVQDMRVSVFDLVALPLPIDRISTMGVDRIL